MERIGIITVLMNNYGSRLQNIATVELLKKRFPNAVVETIVLSSRFSKPNKLYRLFNTPICKKMFLSIKFRGRVNKNNRLLNLHLYLLNYRSLSSLQELNEYYDYFVLGSDQIWNFLREDMAYEFGLFAPLRKIIFNSPSIPRTPFLSDEEIAILKKHLSRYELVNVREHETADLLNQIGIRSNTLIDPTLRLPKTDWEKLTWFIPEKKDCVVCYVLDKKHVMVDKNWITTLTKAGYRIVWVQQHNDIARRDRFGYTPLEFASLIRSSIGVITNSFHGACMARVFGKPVVAIDSEGINIRFNAFLDYGRFFTNFSEFMRDIRPASHSPDSSNQDHYK